MAKKINKKDIKKLIDKHSVKSIEPCVGDLVKIQEEAIQDPTFANTGMLQKVGEYEPLPVMTDYDDVEIRKKVIAECDRRISNYAGAILNLLGLNLATAYNNLLTTNRVDNTNSLYAINQGITALKSAKEIMDKLNRMDRSDANDLKEPEIRIINNLDIGKI